MMWRFENPEFLWLMLVPLVLTLWYVFKRKRLNRRILSLHGPRSLLEQESRRARLWQRLLYTGALGGLALWVVAMARPVETISWTEKKTDGIDIVLALDVSESMEATDFTPNRMVVAKKVIKNFVGKRPNDRIGLVTFGGEAVTICPLTLDHDFVQAQIDAIELRELKQGTAIGMGLANSVTRLKNSRAKSKVIVLITDGDSNVGSVNPMTAALLAKQESIRIYSIGIGKDDRVVVPIYNYDAYGNKTHLIAKVPSYINPALLRDISKLTGANAYMARNSGMLNQILLEIDQLERSKIKMSPRQRTEERFLPLALAAFLIIWVIFLLQETRFQTRYAHSI